MSAADVAISRNLTVERSLRGKRIDVWGLVFEGALLIALLACLAIIVTLVWEVVRDGSGVYSERGFFIGNWPGEIGNTASDISTFLSQPIGVAGWLFTLAVVLFLPLGLYAAFRKSWKLGLVIVGIFVAILIFAGLVSTSDFLTSNL